jgi:acyl-CoA reductase-like NAD-dependent aldehyde dehydrogenase
VTEEQLSVIPDVNRAFLKKTINEARKAFPGRSAVSFGHRKTILANLLKTIGEHADELSVLLKAEQGGPLVQARWEIELLTKAFGPALMQMEVRENEEDGRYLQHLTRRYFPIDNGTVNPWNLPVILSFGKVLPALLAGDTIVLRPSPFSPLTVLRIAGFLRELLPAGVFNVVIGGHDLWPWSTSHSGIDLMAFTRSANIRKLPWQSAAGRSEPFPFGLGDNGSRSVTKTSPEERAVFGRIALVPITWEPGRSGLARTLFEILSFQPASMRAQVLVWSLARKASYSFPMAAV